MFGLFKTTKIDRILDMVKHLDGRMLEMKIMRMEDRAQIMSLTAEVKHLRQYDFVKRVKKPRKQALRKAKGWKNVSPEEAAGYVKDYNSGMGILEIATQANRSSSTVGVWIHKLTDGVKDETSKDSK